MPCFCDELAGLVQQDLRRRLLRLRVELGDHGARRVDRHRAGLPVDQRHHRLVVVELSRGRGHGFLERAEHLFGVDVFLPRHLSDHRRIDVHRNVLLLTISPGAPATRIPAAPAEYRRNGHYRFCGSPHQRHGARRRRLARAFRAGFGCPTAGLPEPFEASGSDGRLGLHAHAPADEPPGVVERVELPVEAGRRDLERRSRARSRRRRRAGPRPRATPPRSPRPRRSCRPRARGPAGGPKPGRAPEVSTASRRHFFSRAIARDLLGRLRFAASFFALSANKKAGLRPLPCTSRAVSVYQMRRRAATGA